MSAVVAGRIIPVTNKDAHHRAAAGYLAVWVEDESGDNERCLLLTTRELERIEKRSRKNLEDWTNKGWVANFFD